MKTRLFWVSAFCAGLLIGPLAVAAQTRDGAPAAPADAAPNGLGKPVVRAPGAATGRQGGVMPPSPRALPAENAAVRSPGSTKAAPSGMGHGGGAADVSLDSAQYPVLDRVNYHRSLAGVAPVEADPRLLRAAQSHSNYLDSTGEAGHYETKKENPFYTGHSPFDRLRAAQYAYAEAGEVVARQPSSHPAAAVDALMSAIYHRFIILSSDFTYAGPGVMLKTHQGTEELNVTVDFGAGALPPEGNPPVLIVYPVDGHLGVAVDFNAAHEFPSPMPGYTLVGYPVSVQVDARHTLVVDSFDLFENASANAGRALQAKLLTHDTDHETPAHAAALIPFSPLAPATSYRAVFSGSVNGAKVSRTWQFTTAPDAPVTMTVASPRVGSGGTQRVTLNGLDSEKGPYYVCYSPARMVKSLTYESDADVVIMTSTACTGNTSCQVTLMATYHSACANAFAQATFVIAP